MKKDFNKISLQSSVFQGHISLYYFYLKTEKIAHVLILLRQKSISPTPLFDTLISKAVEVPGVLVRVATGELNEKQLTAHIFSVLTLLRFLTTQGEIGKDNSTILVQEYETMIERMVEGIRANEFAVSLEQFEVSLPSNQAYSHALSASLGFPAADIKDIYKRHNKNPQKRPEPSFKRQESVGDRTSKILGIIRANNSGVSIKAISTIVRDCSEKTIQRELGVLITQGLIVREGERRWSVYKSAPIL